MPRKQCIGNKRRSLEKQRQILEPKLKRLEKACAAGDQMSCITLQREMASENYREENRSRSELHHRAG